MTTELSKQLIYCVHIKIKLMCIVVCSCNGEKIQYQHNETESVVCGLDYLEIEKLKMVLTYSYFIFYLVRNDNEFMYMSKHIRAIFCGLNEAGNPKIETI